MGSLKAANVHESECSTLPFNETADRIEKSHSAKVCMPKFCWGTGEGRNGGFGLRPPPPPLSGGNDAQRHQKFHTSTFQYKSRGWLGTIKVTNTVRFF